MNWMKLSSFALALGLVGGCAQIAGIEDPDGIVAGKDFRCVGQLSPDRGDMTTMVEIPANVQSITTGAPVPGVRISVCPSRTSAQSECDRDNAVITDDSGLVSVPVISGFDGYLLVEDPDATGDASDFVTYLWYFSQPIVETRTEPFPLFIMTREFRSDIFYADATPQSPTRGELAINIVDCTDQNAPDVRFEAVGDLNEEAQPVYLFNNFWDVPNDAASGRTDGAALGGYLNLEPGTINVEAVDADTGGFIASDTFRIIPDALTTIRLLPE